MYGNPFEPLPPDRLADIYRWPEPALRFLAGEADCLHVVGAPGLGKTTCLQQVRLRLQAAGTPTAYHCVFPLKEDELEYLALAEVTLVDEVDCLPRERLKALLRRARSQGARLALGTHVSLGRSLRREGLTWLDVILRPLDTPAAAVALLEERVTVAAGHGGHGFGLDARAARLLLRLTRGNLERCLQIGYELVEDYGCGATVTAPQVAAAEAALRRALDPPVSSR